MNFKNIFLFLFILLLVSCTKSNNDEILNINNESISQTEFNVYLYTAKKSYELDGGSDIWLIDFDGVKASEMAKNVSYKTIVAVKLANDYAKENKISLNKNEENLAKNDAKAFHQNLNAEDKKLVKADITLIEKIFIEKSIYQKIFNKITENFLLSENDFESYYNENKNIYTSLTLYTVLFKEKLDADLFFDLIKNSGAIIEEEAENMLGNEVISHSEILYKYGSFDENFDKVVYELSLNEIITIESDSGHYFVKLLKKMPDDDVLRHTLTLKYTNEKKGDIFQESLSEWEVLANIKKNQTLWNEIDFFK